MNPISHSMTSGSPASGSPPSTGSLELSLGWFVRNQFFRNIPRSLLLSDWTDRWIDRPTNILTNWSTNPLTNQPTDQLTAWPTNRLTNWPPDQPTDKPTDQPTGLYLSSQILSEPVAPSTEPLEVRKRPEKEEVTSPGLGRWAFVTMDREEGGHLQLLGFGWLQYWIAVLMASFIPLSVRFSRSKPGAKPWNKLYEDEEEVDEEEGQLVSRAGEIFLLSIVRSPRVWQSPWVGPGDLWQRHQVFIRYLSAPEAEILIGEARFGGVVLYGLVNLQQLNSYIIYLIEI